MIEKRLNVFYSKTSKQTNYYMFEVSFLKDAASTFKITSPKGSDYYNLEYDEEKDDLSSK